MVFPYNPQNRIYIWILSEKGLKIVYSWFPKYIFHYKKEACPLETTKSYIFLNNFRLKRSRNCAYLACKIQNFPTQGDSAPFQPLPGGSSPWTPVNAPCKQLVCSLHSQLLEFSQSWKSSYKQMVGALNFILAQGPGKGKSSTGRLINLSISQFVYSLASVSADFQPPG